MLTGAMADSFENPIHIKEIHSAGVTAMEVIATLTVKELKGIKEWHTAQKEGMLEAIDPLAVKQD